MTQNSNLHIDEKLTCEIANFAGELASGAGEILLGYFGRSMTVEYKDEAKRDMESAKAFFSRERPSEAERPGSPHAIVEADNDCECKNMVCTSRVI